MRVDEGTREDVETVKSYKVMTNGEANSQPQAPCTSTNGHSASFWNGQDRIHEPTETYDANQNNARSCPLVEQHQGKAVLRTLIQLPVDAVFNLLFLHNEFMAEVLAARNVSDIVVTPWEAADVGKRVREMSYTMFLSISNLASKAASVTEKQVVQESLAGETYVVETEATNTGIPYADAFTVCNHYCLSRSSADSTILTVWSLVKYKKNVWNFVKGMLEKNAYNGIDALMLELQARLTVEAEKVANTTGIPRKRLQAHRDRRRPHTHKQNAKKGAESPPPLNPFAAWLGFAMVVALVVLVMGNAVLYTRLSHLEHLARLQHLNQGQPSQRSPGATEAWAEDILRRQEQLQYHQEHIWKTQIEHVSLKLQEVQESLELLLSMVPEHQQSLRDILRDSCLQPEVYLQEKSSQVERVEIESSLKS